MSYPTFSFRCPQCGRELGGDFAAGGGACPDCGWQRAAEEDKERGPVRRLGLKFWAALFAPAIAMLVLRPVFQQINSPEKGAVLNVIVIAGPLYIALVLFCLVFTVRALIRNFTSGTLRGMMGTLVAIAAVVTFQIGLVFFGCSTS